MIKPENLIPVSMTLTERKLQLCKIIKEQLIKESINKSEEEITEAVSKVNNSQFLTKNEKQTRVITTKQNVIQDLIKQNPNLLNIIHRELFN